MRCTRPCRPPDERGYGPTSAGFLQVSANRMPRGVDADRVTRPLLRQVRQLRRNTAVASASTKHIAAQAGSA